MEQRYNLVLYNLLLTGLIWSAWLLWVGPAETLINIVSQWEVASTMLLGSLVAGATSEGGGAVAFPIFTKVLNVIPENAKLFSLFIQAIGMSTAAAFIIMARLPVEWRAVILGSLGGVIGFVIGYEAINPLFSPEMKKMAFTALIASLGITLVWLNIGNEGRNTKIPHLGQREQHYLLLAGILGGCLSSLVGNGIDIVVFSLLVTLFKVSEKVATPTSVILMAVNSVGASVYLLWQAPVIPPEVVSYWKASVPIVVFGAPFGAFLCAKISRTTLVSFLLGLIALDISSSLLLVPVDYQVALSTGILFFGFLAFFRFAVVNKRYSPNLAFS